MERNGRKGSLVMEPTERWTPQSASDLYDVASWGKGYFSVGENGHVLRPPREGPGALHRSQGTGRHAGAARHQPADPDPLRRHPEAPPGRNPQRLRDRHHRAQVPGRLLLRLPDQGEPAAPGGGRGSGVRQALPLRPGSRLQTGADGRDGAGRQRDAHHLQRLQGRRVHRDGHAGPEDGPQDHPGGRKVHRAAPDPEIQPARRRAADHRPARQAGQPRLGALEILGRLPLEVRPLGHRGDARAAGAERPRHGRLPQPAALPPGQPDHQHPPDQGRGERSRRASTWTWRAPAPG